MEKNFTLVLRVSLKLQSVVKQGVEEP